MRKIVSLFVFLVVAFVGCSDPPSAPIDTSNDTAADIVEMPDKTDTAPRDSYGESDSESQLTDTHETDATTDSETAFNDTKASDTEPKDTGNDETDSRSPEPNGFGSVVRLENHCTAVKIGASEILTAAHCVAKNSEPVLRYTFKSGRSFKIYNGEHIAKDSSGRDVTVERTKVHPEWMQCAFDTQGVCGTYAHATKYPHPPDIALIVVEESLPEPHAQVNAARVEAGEQVIVTGYGCDQQQNRGALTESTIKHGENTVLPKDKAGPFARAYPNYFPTPGESEANGELTLCAGDSGGPVFRVDTNPRRLVGINSTHQTNSNQDPSSLNVHTRVSEKTRHDIASWLETSRPK